MERCQVVVFTGGGSGGHVYPGLAVAVRVLRESGVSVRWFGSRGGVERSLVMRQNIPFYAIPSGKLRRYFSWKNGRDIFLVAAGVLVALFSLYRIKPRVLFSKGGYVSVPVVVAAWVLRIPIISHESDLVPGLATTLNLTFSRALLLSFAESKKWIPAARAHRCFVTGNPVRAIVYSADSARGRRYIGAPPVKKVVLFLGGSLGAAQINTLAWGFLGCTDGYTVVHQTGKGVGSGAIPPAVRERVLKNGVHYLHKEFFGEEIADIMAAADVVVSRAGATTLWECATLARAMVLVPLPRTASRGDQIDNAAYFEQRGAARVLADPTAEALAEEVGRLTHTEGTAARMGKRAQGLVTAHSTERVAEHIVAALSVRR